MTGQSLVSELTLTLRGLFVLFYKEAAVEPLLDADIELELKRNVQLKNSPQEQEKFRRDYKQTIIDRLNTLRHNLFGSFFFLCTATGLAFLVLHLASHPIPKLLGAASVFFLAWSTLARLGHPGRSFGGDSVIERLDEHIFKFLFWVGTFLGMLALT